MIRRWWENHAETAIEINELFSPDKYVNNYRPHPKDREGNVFSLFTTGGGDTPVPAGEGGYPPWPGLGLGTTSQGRGTPNQD